MPTINLNEDEDEGAPNCAPPTTRRPPGRPHKKRNQANEYVTRKKNFCGRCLQRMHHNARPCNEPIG
ncbi:hypothetical protein V1524DRAFT_407550 [Lipomyces starkeyi]